MLERDKNFLFHTISIRRRQLAFKNASQLYYYFLYIGKYSLFTGCSDECRI